MYGLIAHPAVGATGLVGSRLQVLHLVGEDEVGDPPVQECGLARQVHQLRERARMEDRLGPLGHLPEGGL